jgi:hypothetical protein
LVVHLPALRCARGPTSPSARLKPVCGAAGPWSQICLSNRKCVSACYASRLEADCEVGRRDGSLLPAAPAAETKEHALEHLFKESESVEAFETVALRLMTSNRRLRMRAHRIVFIAFELFAAGGYPHQTRRRLHSYLPDEPRIGCGRSCRIIQTSLHHGYAFSELSDLRWGMVSEYSVISTDAFQEYGTR